MKICQHHPKGSKTLNAMQPQKNVCPIPSVFFDFAKKACEKSYTLLQLL